MPEVLTRVDEGETIEVDIKPPEIGFVRFCPRCGRNDRISPMRERHFAGGELCPGVPVTLEYALVNPERAGLEREVIKAAKAELAAYDAPGTFGWTAASMSARYKLRKATRALIDFESQHVIQK